MTRVRLMLPVLGIVVALLAIAPAAAANPTCPDADGDGICNGQDPDYVPGTAHPDCPDADGDGICNGDDPDYVPGAPCPGNPLCPDADGDGICNGQDPDYTPGMQWMLRFLGLGPQLGRLR